MKVAEFFAVLGFKVEGADKLTSAQTQLQKSKANVERLGSELAVLTKQSVLADAATQKFAKGTKENTEAAAKASKLSTELKLKKKQLQVAQEDLNDVTKEATKAQKEHQASLNNMAGEATKAAVAVNAINVAFLAMIRSASLAGQILDKFKVTTGLSSNELQSWQLAAAKFGVGADEIQSSVKGIQDQQAAIALGGGDISAFQFFGIDAREKDPFAVLSKLKDRLKEFNDQNIGYARQRAQAMGINDNMFYLLRKEGFALEDVQKQLKLTDKEQEALALNAGTWQGLLASAGALITKFAATFAPAMTKAAQALQWMVNKLAIFVDWLHKGSLAATVIKTLLIVLAGVMLALGGALAVVAIGLGAAAAAMTVISTRTAAWAATLAPLLVTLGVAAAARGAIVLVIDDVITEAEGGKSVLGEFFTSFHQPVDALAAAMEFVIGLIDILTGKLDVAKEHFKEMAKDVEDSLPGAKIGEGINWLTGGSDADIAKMSNGGKGSVQSQLARQHAAAAEPSISRAVTTVNNKPDIDVHIDGSQSPKETGRAVVGALAGHIGLAKYQQPVASW